jgi:hypothetical protein
VDEELENVIGAYVTLCRADFAENPNRVRSEVVDRLEAVSLAVGTEAGLVVHPAAARYRADPQRSRRKRTSAEQTDDDPGLFAFPSEGSTETTPTEAGSHEP